VLVLRERSGNTESRTHFPNYISYSLLKCENTSKPIAYTNPDLN